MQSEFDDPSEIKTQNNIHLDQTYTSMHLEIFHDLQNTRTKSFNQTYMRNQTKTLKKFEPFLFKW